MGKQTLSNRPPVVLGEPLDDLLNGRSRIIVPRSASPVWRTLQWRFDRVALRKFTYPEVGSVCQPDLDLCREHPESEAKISAAMVPFDDGDQRIVE